MKQRNPNWGCPRIAQQIALAFNIQIDKDVVRGILACHYRPGQNSGGPSWLTFLGHMKDSFWSMDLFRCESATLRIHWVLVVMDQFTRRIIGFGVHAGTVDGVALCRMFNRAIRSQRRMPKYLNSDNDPLYRFHQWQAFLMLPGSGTISAANFLVLTTPPNIFSGTSTGTGGDTTSGAFTFSSAWTTTLTDSTDFLVSNGTFVDTFAGGTVTGTITGSGTVNPITLATTFTENLVFTSGTGIFAGETGQATLSGMGTFALSGPSTASYTGTFTTPEPSTLVLLSASLLGLMGMGLRKKRLA